MGGLGLNKAILDSESSLNLTVRAKDKRDPNLSQGGGDLRGLQIFFSLRVSRAMKQ